MPAIILHADSGLGWLAESCGLIDKLDRNECTSGFKMANETFALLSQDQQVAVGEDDYQSFCMALSSSARGRAFLAEYARRNRHADTEVVLNALTRLEEAARNQVAAPEAERIRQDLRALLETIRSARPQIDNSPSAIKAATLASLIDFMQARIEALASPALAQFALSEVPPLEQPELPIPQPISLAPPAIALVPAAMVPAAVTPAAVAPRAAERDEPIFGPDFAPPEFPHVSQIIPEIDFIAFDAPVKKAPARIQPVAPPRPAQTAAVPIATTPAGDTAPSARETAISALAAMIEFPEPVAVEASAPETEAVTLEFVEIETIETETIEIKMAEIEMIEPQAATAAATPVAQPMPDPLAGILALTEEERIALFS